MEKDRFEFKLTRFEVRGGTTIELPPTGVTAIVGGNNAGKSTLLQELAHGAQQDVAQRVEAPGNLIVTQLEFSRRGSHEAMQEWLTSHRVTFMSDANHMLHRPYDYGPEDPRRWPASGENITGLLVFHATAHDRIQQTSGVRMREGVSDPPQFPLHYMEDDRAVFDKLNAISLRVFDKPLTLDDLSATMNLRVGTPSISPPAVGESKLAYRQALGKLKLLQEQGDGMRSLFGLLLPLMTMRYPVIIVDEPEAFLHPPQAYALGQILGEMSLTAEAQIVVATHDRSFLAGLLNSGAPLSVVRLNRDGDDTTAHQLRADTLRGLWSDEVLRYSNVLDGLFHRLVIVAEAERDCRFYQAALDALPEDAGNPEPIVKSDVLFVPSNGKTGMQRLVGALRAVAVTVVATPDLDVLNDEAVIRGLVESLGGNWSTYARDYAIATSDFRQPRMTTTVGAVRGAVTRWLDEWIQQYGPETPWNADAAKELRSQTRSPDSPWKALKEYGQAAFKGQGAVAAESLLKALDQLGVVCVREGELENFAPALGIAKGARWLPGALEAGAHRAESASRHIRRLIANRL